MAAVVVRAAAAAVLLCATTGAADGWGDDLDRAARPLAGLFANATFLTYVATHGTYRNATSANATALGPASASPRCQPPNQRWERQSTRLAPRPWRRPRART